MIIEHATTWTAVECDDGRAGAVCMVSAKAIVIAGPMHEAVAYGIERGWVFDGEHARCPACEGQRRREESAKLYERRRR